MCQGSAEDLPRRRPGGADLNQRVRHIRNAGDGKYKPNQDWNHAWGAAPANILPRMVLGVQPLEPGYMKVLIAPRTGGLTWARGMVPTVRAAVAVDWRTNAAEIRRNGPSYGTISTFGAGVCDTVWRIFSGSNFLR
jgi:hypothetical protein